MKLFSLAGRVAVVTGGGRGIGRAIAEGLGAHGAQVVCAARTRTQLDEAVATIRDAGGDALAVEMDLSDLESLQQGAQMILDHYGQIDILVNNAGMNIREPMEQVTEGHYDQIMAVNLKGLYFLTKAVVNHMIPRKQGKIIHIGSLTSGIGLPGVAVYTATKGAVGQLTKVQAMELARHNIQVNAIGPGFILTHLTEKLWAQPHMDAWGKTRIPAGRLGRPEDMIGTAVFLASSAADYVTGQLIYVDGGVMSGDMWPTWPMD